jgi:hypothetical protein
MGKHSESYWEFDFNIPLRNNWQSINSEQEKKGIVLKKI